ncbi:MAG: membrane protein insertase YidC [Thermodesulfobacteriota bacterium]
MEQARMLLAIVLSFLVFLIWNMFFAETPETPVDQAPTRQSEKAALSPPALPPSGSHQETAATSIIEATTASSTPMTLQREPRVLQINTPLFTVAVTETGAAVTSCRLSNYREHVGADSPLKELIDPKNSDGTFLLDWKTASMAGADKALFQADSPEDQISISAESRTITFSWQSPEGVLIRKAYTFSPDSYLIELAVTVVNNSSQPLKGDLVLSMLQHWGEKPHQYGFEGPGALLNNRFETIEVKDLEDQSQFTGKLQWVSIQDRYFLTAVIPKIPADGVMNLSLDSRHILGARYHYPIQDIPPNGQQTSVFDLYLGPKSVSILQQTGYHLDKAVDFGFFDVIAKPCLWLMNQLHRYIPNYGVAIIVLTILIKILFWPLGNKSYKSMNEMKKLQPLMAAIREKYKDDKKKMNEEVMGLYKTYKINPLGGCLPMVAQIPVFFALYQMLYGAIELRHAPFFAWINDLSAPDRLFDLSQYGISIPLMEPPFGIPVLTIIMGATMLIQQKLQPPPGDPTQAKMMMFMPIIFTVIFINFSSGLVLYWLVNNVLSIAQQYYVSRKHA